jgi:hypothetical protein
LLNLSSHHLFSFILHHHIAYSTCPAQLSTLIIYLHSFFLNLLQFNGAKSSANVVYRISQTSIDYAHTEMPQVPLLVFECSLFCKSLPVKDQ